MYKKNYYIFSSNNANRLPLEISGFLKVETTDKMSDIFININKNCKEPCTCKLYLINNKNSIMLFDLSDINGKIKKHVVTNVVPDSTMYAISYENNKSVCYPYIANGTVEMIPETNTAIIHSAPKKKQLLISDYISKMDKLYKRTDPFGTNRTDYIWWKIINPIYFSDILLMFDINPSLVLTENILMHTNIYWQVYMITDMLFSVCPEKKNLPLPPPGYL